MNDKPWFLEREGISFRQWKQQKRSELLACEIDQMMTAHSVKQWGR